MLKSWGWWGGVVVAHVIIESAPVQRIGFLVFFLTWSDLRVRIGGLLGQGIGDLDSGLTISTNVKTCREQEEGTREATMVTSV